MLLICEKHMVRETEIVIHTTVKHTFFWKQRPYYFQMLWK